MGRSKIGDMSWWTLPPHTLLTHHHKKNPYSPEEDIIFNISCSFYSQNSLRKNMGSLLWILPKRTYLSILKYPVLFIFIKFVWKKIIFQFIIIFLFEWAECGWGSMSEKWTWTQMRLFYIDLLHNDILANILSCLLELVNIAHSVLACKLWCHVIIIHDIICQYQPLVLCGFLRLFCILAIHSHRLDGIARSCRDDQQLTERSCRVHYQWALQHHQFPWVPLSPRLLPMVSH
jgi:hypothetical protein